MVLICFSTLHWLAVVQSTLGRKCHFKFCQLGICWSSTLPWSHLQICSMYYLKKNDQRISKPYLRTCGTSSVWSMILLRSVLLSLWRLRFLLNWFRVSTSNGSIHPLNYVHHTSTYQASLCKLMEYWWEEILLSLCPYAIFHLDYLKKDYHAKVGYLDSCSLNPTISALQGRLKENEIRVNWTDIFFQDVKDDCAQFEMSWLRSLLYQLNMLMEEAQSLEVEARGRKSGMHSESPRSHVARGFRGSPSVGTRDLHASADSAVTRAPSGSASRRKAPWSYATSVFWSWRHIL